MAKKDVLFGFQLADAQSLAAAFNSSAFRVKFLDNVCFNVETSGVTVNEGTFAVEHRIVKDIRPVSPVMYSAWAELTLSSIPTLGGADQTFMISLNQVPPGELRIKFASPGGSANGTCDIWVSATSLGG